ncbi:MAG: hypothetical protein HFJ79_07880 [Clostridiales bacterium]|nr:hypothetical protein [Clostridiales bacterium]
MVMKIGYHGRAPYRDDDMEAAAELSPAAALAPDPFSEEPHTLPHGRRNAQRPAGVRNRRESGTASGRENGRNPEQE